MKDPNASALGRKGGKRKTAAKASAARLNATKPPRPGKSPRGRPFKETTRAAWLAISELIENSEQGFSVDEATDVCRMLTEGAAKVRKNRSQVAQVAREIGDSVTKIASKHQIAISGVNRVRLYAIIGRFVKS